MGLLAVSLYFFDYDRFFTPNPTRNIQLLKDERRGDWKYLSISFEKINCTYKFHILLGISQNRTDILEWDNVDVKGKPYKPDFSDSRTDAGDRLKGFHVWNLRVKAPALLYDRIELRTRHVCQGRIVDKIFIKVPG